MVSMWVEIVTSFFFCMCIFLIRLRHSGRYCISFPIRKGPGLRGGLPSKPCCVQRESSPGVLVLEDLWSFLDFYLPGGLNSHQCLCWEAVVQHSREHTCSTFWSKEATGKNETFSGWLYLLYLTTTLISETEPEKKYLTDSRSLMQLRASILKWEGLSESSH